MSTTTDTTRSENTFENADCIRIDGKSFYDLVGQICEISERQLNRNDYFGQCFESISEHFNASVGVMNIRQGARTIERTFSVDEALTKKWIQEIDPLLLRSQTDNTSLSKIYHNPSGIEVGYAIAAPFRGNSGNAFGAVALTIQNGSAFEMKSQLIQLCQIIELVAFNAPSSETQNPKPTQSGSNALKTVIRASDYQSIHHLSFAIVNSLCGKFQCEQVSLGIVRNRNVRLMAVSGLSEIPKNTPGVMAIQQAMAVCSDRNETTVVQQKGKQSGQVDSSSCRIHHFWHNMSGDACVATMPLRIEGKCVAVVALRRQSNQPFSTEDLQRIQLISESFAPALPLVDRASRSVARHIGESLVAQSSNLFSRNNLGLKLLAVLALFLAGWIAFGKIEHRVRAHCKIVPEKTYTVSVPREGMIAKVMVVPGQKIREGDLLVQLDIKDLLIEQKSLLANIISKRIEANAMLSERKSQEAFLLQAEIEVLETDLNLIEEQIGRSRIKAHQDGIVMPTKIHQRVGQFVAMGEQLLEIANEDRWHLEVEIPESKAIHIKKTQRGTFQSAARPDRQLECEVTKVSPSSEVLNQRNVFVAEAVLHKRDEWMKLGMEGNVCLNTGQKPVWWVYGHPFLDFVRLKLWL